MQSSKPCIFAAKRLSPRIFFGKLPVMKHQVPYAHAGQVIGLLGGSFDPAHGGHVNITKHALKRFGLDQVWWLVSPGNPLKSLQPATMARRMRAARDVMDHPRVTITDIETRLGTRVTADTLAGLRAMYPRVRFVWLMGADNLVGFHRWIRWRDIMDTTPIGILARPRDGITARCAPAARIYRHLQLPARRARLLGRHPAPQWCFVNIPMRDDSSTLIRARGDWSNADGLHDDVRPRLVTP